MVLRNSTNNICEGKCLLFDSKFLFYTYGFKELLIYRRLVLTELMFLVQDYDMSKSEEVLSTLRVIIYSPILMNLSTVWYSIRNLEKVNTNIYHWKITSLLKNGVSLDVRSLTIIDETSLPSNIHRN